MLCGNYGSMRKKDAIFSYAEFQFEKIRFFRINRQKLKKQIKEQSNCCQNHLRFNYHGIQKALCGKNPSDYGKMYFIPKRILVIQME